MMLAFSPTAPSLRGTAELENEKSPPEGGLIYRGRGGGIRTHDLFVPNEARYQAALRPETNGENEWRTRRDSNPKPSDP